MSIVKHYHDCIGQLYHVFGNKRNTWNAFITLYGYDCGFDYQRTIKLELLEKIVYWVDEHERVADLTKNLL